MVASETQLSALRNRYFAMRHGHSLANRAGIIVSHPENGVDDYGLSDTGVLQVEQGIAASDLPAAIRIVSSDFKRARESAQIAYRQLACVHAVKFDARLRERYFGKLELGADTRYKAVWQADARNPLHGENNVETVQSVVERAIAVVHDCEQAFAGEVFLLVAHGDILQILQTAFAGIDANRHRELPHLETAEVRALN